MKKWLILSLLLLCLLPLGAQAEETPLSLIALNVGKADCLLLQSGEDTYMIDTGTEQSYSKVASALETLGITHLTGVIITHTDKDHTGGLMQLAKSDLQIDAWYAPAYFSGVKMKKHPANIAALERDEQVVWLAAGDTLPLENASLTVLMPYEKVKKENCNSLVLLAEGGGGSMLLCGDMEIPEEEALMKRMSLPQVDVLKIGNHGENDASGDVFLYTVRPKVAVISTNSAEERDTPAPRILKALKKINCQIALTQHAPLGVKVTLEHGEGTVEMVR